MEEMSSVDDDSLLLDDVDKLSQVLASNAPSETIQLDCSKSGRTQSDSSHTLASAPEATPARFDTGTCLSDSVYLDNSPGEQYGHALSSLDNDIPANLENCLTLNKAYQEVVDESLDELMTHLGRIQQRREALETEISSQALVCGHSKASDSHMSEKTPGWGLFYQKYFSGPSKFGPALHSISNQKRVRCEYVDLRVSKFWSRSEHEKLYKAVTDLVRSCKRRVISTKICLVDEKERIEREKQTPDTLQLASFSHLRNELIDECSQLEKLSPEHFTGEPNDEHDWLEISSKTFDGLREADECSRQWRNWVHPSVNHDCWTREEDETIIKLVKQLTLSTVHKPPQAFVWERISRRLRTGRTALQVFQRWVVALQESPLVYWGVEETRQLLAVISRVRHDSFISWADVAFYMDMRTPQQCRMRFFALNPAVVRGQFSDNEDRVLVAGVDGFQLSFTDIASVLKQRTVDQLRRRYTSRLSSCVNVYDWSRSEEEKLIQLVWQHGARWRDIRKYLATGRTPGDCRHRFIRIQRQYRLLGRLSETGTLAGRDPSNKMLSHLDRIRGEAITAARAILEQDGGATIDKRLLLKQYCLSLRRDNSVSTDSETGELIQTTNAALKPDPTPSSRCNRAQSRRDFTRTESSESLRSSVKFGPRKSRRELSPLALSIGRLLLVRAPFLSGRSPQLNIEAAGRLTSIYCSVLGLDFDNLSESTNADNIENDWVRRHMTDTDLNIINVLARYSDSNSPLPSDLHRKVFDGETLVWKQYPLLPPSRANLAVFRSLLHLRGFLERFVVGDCSDISKRLSASELSWALSRCASQAIRLPPTTNKPPGPASWFQPNNRARHRDNLAQVNIVHYDSHGEHDSSRMRVTPLLLPLSDALNHRQLLRILCHRIPNICKITVSQAPVAVAKRVSRMESPDSLEEPSQLDGDHAAWNCLVSRFVSLFLWPSLLSFDRCSSVASTVSLGSSNRGGLPDSAHESHSACPVIGASSSEESFQTSLLLSHKKTPDRCGKRLRITAPLFSACSKTSTKPKRDNRAKRICRS